MQKEKVTTYEIKKELIYCKYQSIIVDTIAILGLVFIYAAIIEAFFDAILPSELSLIFLLYLVYRIPATCKKYNKMIASFTVRKDTLVSRREAKTGGKYTSYQPYRLTFTDGYFDIYKRKYYKWSSLYAMKDVELYDSSYLGDTFTIIEYGIEIQLVYNDNYFDVQV